MSQASQASDETSDWIAETEREIETETETVEVSREELEDLKRENQILQSRVDALCDALDNVETILGGGGRLSELAESVETGEHAPVFNPSEESRPNRSERARALQRDVLARSEARPNGCACLVTSDAMKIVAGDRKTVLKAMSEAGADIGFEFDQKTLDHGGRTKQLKIDAENVPDALLEALRGGME